MVRRGSESLLFYDALMKEDDRIKNGWTEFWRYMGGGLYSDQVGRFIDTFGREKVHIIIFDDFNNNPLAEIQKVCLFLDVSDDFYPDTSVVHNRSIIYESRLTRFLLSFLEGKHIKLIKKMIPRVFIDQLARTRKSIKNALLSNAEEVGIDDKSLSYLCKYYKEDVDKLSRMLNINLSLRWLP